MPHMAHTDIDPNLPLGVRLRTRRLALNLSLDEAAQQCGVRKEFLIALERHDLSALPTIGYGLGYVRAYARLLGLNTETSVADFKTDSEVPSNLNRPDQPHFVPKRRVRLPKGFAPALGVVAAVVMLGTWYGVQLETVAAPDDNIAVFDPSDVEPAAPIPDTILTLRTTAPSWVSIRDGRGRLVVNRVFVTDESWQAEVGQTFTLDVRDSGAVDVYIGDRNLGPIGDAGMPQNDIDLSLIR